MGVNGYVNKLKLKLLFTDNSMIPNEKIRRRVFSNRVDLPSIVVVYVNILKSENAVNNTFSSVLMPGPNIQKNNIVRGYATNETSRKLHNFKGNDISVEYFVS